MAKFVTFRAFIGQTLQIQSLSCNESLKNLVDRLLANYAMP